MCSVCVQLPGFWSGVSGSCGVRKCISAQVTLYNLGTVECRLGLYSFEVPGQLIKQDIFARGQSECCIVGPELQNYWTSGPGV